MNNVYYYNKKERFRGSEMSQSQMNYHSVKKVNKWINSNNDNNKFYYMAVSQKDWKQTNSRIWLAKVDLDRGLDFPI